jgi:hypothetical protein
MITFFLAFLVGFPLLASAQGRDQRFARPGARVEAVPGFYPNPYWGYNWGWGEPFWGYGPYYPLDTTGKIKIKDENKYDQVYVNGAFAGRVEKLKSMYLDPGSYDIRIHRNGKELLSRNVYVIVGKTVEINVNGE